MRAVHVIHRVLSVCTFVINVTWLMQITIVYRSMAFALFCAFILILQEIACMCKASVIVQNICMAFTCIIVTCIMMFADMETYRDGGSGIARHKNQWPNYLMIAGALTFGFGIYGSFGKVWDCLCNWWLTASIRSSQEKWFKPLGVFVMVRSFTMIWIMSSFIIIPGIVMRYIYGFDALFSSLSSTSTLTPATPGNLTIAYGILMILAPLIVARGWLRSTFNDDDDDDLDNNNMPRTPPVLRMFGHPVMTVLLMVVNMLFLTVFQCAGYSRELIVLAVFMFTTLILCCFINMVTDMDKFHDAHIVLTVFIGLLFMSGIVNFGDMPSLSTIFGMIWVWAIMTRPPVHFEIVAFCNFVHVCESSGLFCHGSNKTSITESAIRSTVRLCAVAKQGVLLCKSRFYGRLTGRITWCPRLMAPMFTATNYYCARDQANLNATQFPQQIAERNRLLRRFYDIAAWKCVGMWRHSLVVTKALLQTYQDHCVCDNFDDDDDDHYEHNRQNKYMFLSMYRAASSRLKIEFIRDAARRWVVPLYVDNAPLLFCFIWSLGQGAAGNAHIMNIQAGFGEDWDEDAGGLRRFLVSDMSEEEREFVLSYIVAIAGEQQVNTAFHPYHFLENEFQRALAKAKERCKKETRGAAWPKTMSGIWTRAVLRATLK